MRLPPAAGLSWGERDREGQTEGGRRIEESEKSGFPRLPTAARIGARKEGRQCERGVRPSIGLPDECACLHAVFLQNAKRTFWAHYSLD